MGRHGQKGQKRAGRQHRKHIAKVGGGGDLDVFNHVGIGPSALDDSPLQHHQVLLQQDHGGGLLGDVHRRIHRDAHIRGLHGGRVVDAVAQVSHAVAVFPEDPTTRAFCSGESFANTLTVSASSPQLPVVELLQIGAQEDPVHVQPHLLADGAGDLLIVTGQDLYLDAILHQRLDRRFCGLLGRSRNARNPISTISDSSATENCPTGAGLVFWATAITRIPFSFS